MDADRFDALARALRTTLDRRGLFAGLSALGAGLLGEPGADTKRRKRKRKKSRHLCERGFVPCPGTGILGARPHCCPLDKPNCGVTVDRKGLCCPLGEKACPPSPTNPLGDCCPIDAGCCQTMDGALFCCLAPAVCPLRPSAEFCCAATCEDDRECPADSFCAPFGCCELRGQMCIARGQTVAAEPCGQGKQPCCGTSGTFSCCTAEQACCDGFCCPPGEECGPNRRCRIRCDEGERRCEDESGTFSCCPDEQACCGSFCCPPGEHCGPDSRCTP